MHTKARQQALEQLMAHALQAALISEEEYLAGEELSDIKHEYIDGYVYAMSGASINHSTITGNIYSEIRAFLKGKPCRPHTSDVKAKIGSQYFYPDMMVDCSNPDGKAYYTETPTIIVEVLSKSTRRTDKITKRQAYLQIPTLQEYLLIEQDFVEVEVMRKSEHWQSAYYYLGDEVTLDSIGMTLSVEAIYDRVQNSDMAEWLAQKAEQSNNQ